jgi:hypothetical protein
VTTSRQAVTRPTAPLSTSSSSPTIPRLPSSLNRVLKPVFRRGALHDRPEEDPAPHPSLSTSTSSRNPAFFNADDLPPAVLCGAHSPAVVEHAPALPQPSSLYNEEGKEFEEWYRQAEGKLQLMEERFSFEELRSEEDS